MRPPAELLTLPAERGARWLALRFLDEAAAGHARLGTAEDAEALHDFRVGLRRLRSLMRAYRRELGGSVGRKDLGRVRDLARATGESRDLEVQIAWLAAERERMESWHRPGVDALLAHLRERKSAADVRLHREAAKRFPKERKRLAKRLAVYEASVSLEQPGEGAPLSVVLAALVGEAAAELRQRLDAARSIEDQEEAHEARIAAKRLRYLLEPFDHTSPAVRAAVKELKKLQETLGEMHDAEVLRDALVAEEHAVASSAGGAGEGDAADAPSAADLRSGLEALGHRLYARRAEAWETFRPWLGASGARLFTRVEQVRAGLAAAGRPRDVEIERKFLLKRFPRLPEGAAEQEIEQGWLPGERLQERVRRVRTREGEKYYRTVKVGTGITRMELEEETTRDVFRRLWPLTKGKRVRKRRYTAREGGLAWEIDRFSGHRLVLAEVELPSESHPVEIPAWLRAVLEREVTGEREYVNINLAR